MTMNMSCINEWDRCLPSPDELTPLSQALIPHELASAFNITPSSSASACTVTTPTSDVLNASQSAFESLLRIRSVLLPSVESNQKGGAETVALLSTNTETRIHARSTTIKPLTEASDSVQVTQAGRVGGVWMAGAISSTGTGNDHGSALGQGISGGISRLMASSYPQMGASLGADESHSKALLEDGRGGSGRTGGSMLDASAFMQLKVDPSEEVDSGPSMDAFQGNSVSMSNEDQSARTLKKPRLVWTPQLHKRFVDAVAHLGIKHAVPKTIMQLMNVDGLTRENVASHLQKYRLYLKRIQGLSTEGPSASDHLFASTPVPPSLTAPPHFLVSHPSQHLDHQSFGPVHNASLPSMLGHTVHHVPSHISSVPSFSSFNTRPAFSTLSRVPPPAPPGSSEHVRESYLQQQSRTPSGHVLTLFPPSGS